MRSLLPVILLLISSYAVADESVEQPGKRESWYHVEVLIFESGDQDAFNEEWPISPGRPSFEEAIELIAANDEFDDMPEYSLLDDSALKLTTARKRIQKHYRLVMHKAWRQPLVKKKEAKSVRVQGGKEYPMGHYAFSESLPEIDGMIRFSGGKYLHVDSDILFHKPMIAINTENSYGGRLNTHATAKFAPIANNQDWQHIRDAKLQPFRLKSSSRLRLNQIQYFDHPMYGVMIMVSQEKQPLAES